MTSGRKPDGNETTDVLPKAGMPIYTSRVEQGGLPTFMTREPPASQGRSRSGIGPERNAEVIDGGKEWDDCEPGALKGPRGYPIALLTGSTSRLKVEVQQVR